MALVPIDPSDEGLSDVVALRFHRVVEGSGDVALPFDVAGKTSSDDVALTAPERFCLPFLGEAMLDPSIIQ